jgi:hypothetical protein
MGQMGDDGVCRHPPRRPAQETAVEHDAHRAAPVGHGPDLVVLQVAPGRAYTAHAGVGDDWGEVRGVRVERVPEATLGDVG